MSLMSERILKSIKNAGLSYGELHERTGIPKSALQRYATGETEKIPLDRVEAIAKATEVSAAYLMGWADRATENTLPPKPVFIDTFAMLCQKKNISMNKACTEIGISRTATAKWKNGSVPNGVTLNRIAEYFGVSVDYLLGKEKEPTTGNGSGLDDKIKEISTRIAALPADKQKAVLDLLDILDQYDKADR